MRATTADRLRAAASALAKAARSYERDQAEIHERVLGGGSVLELETKLARVRRRIAVAMQDYEASLEDAAGSVFLEFKASIFSEVRELDELGKASR